MSFSTQFAGAVAPLVYLHGESGANHEVNAELINGRIVFTRGWSEFVRNERIVAGDVAMFILVDAHNIVVRLFWSNGASKPLSVRPVEWNEAIAYEGNVYQGPYAAFHANDIVGANYFPVPAHFFAMDFELGPRLHPTPDLSELMLNVWGNFRCDYPLYCVKLVHSHTVLHNFYFRVEFSRMFPAAVPIPVRFYRGGQDDQVVSSTMRKGYDHMLHVSLPTWRAVRRQFALAEGDIVVMALADVGGVVEIRIFKS
ncbi:unnamed protein product [Urochloa humidicola]